MDAPSVRKRLIQICLLAVVTVAGVRTYLGYVQPEPGALTRDIEAPLKSLFGPQVRYKRPIRFDRANRIVIDELAVPTPGGFEVAGPDEEGRPRMEPILGFQARRVVIDHDVVSLAAGIFRAEAITIEGARIMTHETRSGIAPDFPLRLTQDDETSRPPHITLEEAEFVYRAMVASERLRGSAVVKVRVIEVEVAPQEGGEILVRGTLQPRDVGQDDARVTVDGRIETDGSFRISATWFPLELTPELLDLLPEAQKLELEAGKLRSGKLTLELVRVEGTNEGAISPTVSWVGDVEVGESLGDLPAIQQLDQETRTKLEELFGAGALDVKMRDGRVTIQDLESSLGSGMVSANGWIAPESGALHIDFRIKDLDLEDPAIRRALGPEGAAIFDEFDAEGFVDAVGKVERKPGGELEWRVDVILEDVTISYVGAPNEEGKREGFPYAIREATGRVRIRPEGVFFDDILGFNGGAEITLYGHGRKAWTGREAGTIRFTDHGAAVHITVEAVNVPWDERLEAAFRGSEFPEMLDLFALDGRGGPHRDRHPAGPGASTSLGEGRAARDAGGRGLPLQASSRSRSRTSRAG